MSDDLVQIASREAFPIEPEPTGPPRSAASGTIPGYRRFLGRLPIRKGFLRDWGEFALGVGAIMIFLNTYVWQNFKIPTSSMENTLLIGDHITVNKFLFGPRAFAWEDALMPSREVRRGDVVVLKFPGQPKDDWIKRCIALPGDRFEIIQDVLYINGQPLYEEPYAYYRSDMDSEGTRRNPENKYKPIDFDTLQPGLAHHHYRQFQDIGMPELIMRTKRTLSIYGTRSPEYYSKEIARLESAERGVVPEGFYLVMGDNRNHSDDARSWGLLPRSLIKGRAYLVWWAYGEERGTHQRRGFQAAWVYLRLPLTFWQRTHWGDCFRLIR